MTNAKKLSPMAGLRRLVSSLPETDYCLNAMFLYEDQPTRRWAGEVNHYMERLVTKTSLRTTWWNLADLMNPGVLAGAVSKAIRADVIVVATSGSEGMPLPFYVWVNSWLPHRTQNTSLLIGLLGEVQARNPHAGRLRRFLRTVARRGHLDYLTDERRLPMTADFTRSQVAEIEKGGCACGCDAVRAGISKSCPNR